VVSTLDNTTNPFWETAHDVSGPAKPPFASTSRRPTQPERPALAPKNTAAAGWRRYRNIAYNVQPSTFVTRLGVHLSDEKYRG